MQAPRSTRSDAARISAQLHALSDRTLAERSGRYFKTRKGEYGEGDRFLGIRVPVLRRVAREHKGATAATAFALLKSPFHEERLCALLLLVALFERGSPAQQAAIYRRYLRSIARFVNNWDLVDTSAPSIVGGFLIERGREPLLRLARSRNLWERRVAIIATLALIKLGSFDDTLAIAALLIDDEHDLIHKAVGWMLREVDNRDPAAAKRFLVEHQRRMPRTMLRYAIEKRPPGERRAYLEGRMR